MNDIALITDAYTDSDIPELARLLGKDHDAVQALAAAIREEVDDAGELLRGSVSAERISDHEADLRYAAHIARSMATGYQPTKFVPFDEDYDSDAGSLDLGIARAGYLKRHGMGA